MEKKVVQKSRSLKGIILILAIVLILIVSLIGYQIAEGTGIIKKKAAAESSKNKATISLYVINQEQPIPKRGEK